MLAMSSIVIELVRSRICYESLIRFRQESGGGSGGRSEEQKRSEERRLGKKVANIMHVLGLWKHRKTIIGDERRRGISGGQRKRVNVAMELVMDPSVLFLE